ncbi:IgA FC receptor precursor [Streptococcus mitis]|uniref:IgA FC receptor n=1 Tax=Streptococcus mitis TaxID=28037 RepID=A0A428I663_STRMT|nr:LPXTG cell wall anchor domain-containing protein [Streptococcus mitis]RSK07692.1 IgA FC receptor precursor [Streptococcus mitis]
MNKLTKLGIVTFSAVTLSAAVPTLVRAEENVAPQPNAAARPNTTQPTPAPKPNGSWVDFSMLDPIAKPKPGKEVSKPAEKPVEEPAPVEKPSTEGNVLANGTDEAIAEDKKNAEIEKKYNVDPSNQLPEPGLLIETPEPEHPLTNPEEMKKKEVEDLAYKAGAVMSMTKEENDKIRREANRKFYALGGIDLDKFLATPVPGTNGQGFPTLVDSTRRTYRIQADFLDADRVKEHGYTTESRIDVPKYATVVSLNFDTDRDSADGILTAKKFSDYTFSHVVKSAADHPDIDPDPKVVRVSYDAAYALRGSGYKNGKGDELFRYYFIYTKNKPVEEKPTPKDPQPAEMEKPAGISKPAETVEPTVQPKPAENKPVENPTPTPKPAETPQPEVKPADKPQPAKPVQPAENKPVENKPAETPVPTPKPAETPQPEVKPTEQRQPTQPVKPAENKPIENKSAETPVPTSKPVETPQPEVKPADKPQPAKPVQPAEKPSENPSSSEKPAEQVKPEVKPAEQPQENNRKPVRRWHLRDGSVHEHPVVTYADIVAPLPISDMKETPINGIWTAEKDFINNKPRLTFFWGSGNRYLEENGREFSREELLKSDIFMRPIRVKIPELEGRNYEAYTIYTGIFDGKTGHVELNKNTNITGQGYMVFRTKKEDNDVEVYQFSKNRQLTPLYHRYQLNERGRSVGEFGLYAEVYQTYVFLFKNHTEKPADQAKPEVKPSENPVNPVTPVAPITPTTPVTPTLNPAIPNNTRVLSSIAGNVQVYGSEATLKNVRYIRVEETKSNSLESKKYKAFDIHLYDARGKAIQPNGWVTVSVLANQPVENVYYVNQNGSLFALDFKQNADKVTFETNHFSIYAMTFKVAASRDNGGSTTPVPVVNSSNTEQKGNDVNSTKTQAEPLATKTETISKQVAKILPNTGENNSILATLFGMLTLTAGLFSFRKESE